jgi:hypothetical protein
MDVISHSSGDRVEWFHAEAEMQCWLEQLEIKHAQFMHLIASFCKMKAIWGQLAGKCSEAGKRAYALKQSAVCSRREILLRCGNLQLLNDTLTVDDYPSLAQRFHQYRHIQLKLITDITPEYHFIWNGEKTFKN